MTKKTAKAKKTTKKEIDRTMPKPAGITSGSDQPEWPKPRTSLKPLTKIDTTPPEDNMEVREDGAVYARVTKLCQNKRIVIVTPFNKEFRPGRMTIPSRGAGNKLGKRNRKLWVMPGRDGVYKCVGLANRYS